MPKKPNKAKSTGTGTLSTHPGMDTAANPIYADRVATLKELRKATGHTQDDLAVALGVGQGTVSRIEKRNDMLVSTLQHYIESVGGQMQILVTFPDRQALIIERLGKKSATHHGQDNHIKPPGPNNLPVT